MRLTAALPGELFDGVSSASGDRPHVPDLPQAWTRTPVRYREMAVGRQP